MIIFDKEIFENKKKRQLTNAEAKRINHLYATKFVDVTTEDIGLIRMREYNCALSDLIRDLQFELSSNHHDIIISEIKERLEVLNGA